MNVPLAPNSQLTRRGLLTLAAMAAAATACGVPGSDNGSSEDATAATYFPPSYEDVFPAFNLFLKSAKERARIDFEWFHSEKLLDADQLVQGLFQGVADLIFIPSAYISSSYPIFGAFELPFINGSVDETEQALRVNGPLYDLINEEIGKKGLRLIANMPTSFEWLWTIDKPIRKPEDLEGMRIRTSGDVQGEVVKSLGGSPVSLSSAEVYQALQRGTIDGTVAYVGGVISRDLQEVLRYGTVARFAQTTIDPYVRKEWFDGLDSGTQDGLLKSGQAYLDEGTAAQLRVHEEQYIPEVEQAGIELYEPTGAELKAFEQATVPVYDWWRSRVGDVDLADRALALMRSA